jgi:hypothetical protein
MKCGECDGRGFTERGRGGILRVGCGECEGTGELNITEMQRRIYDNSDDRIERPDTITRSPDTGQPKQPQKPKAKRKAKAKAR